MKTLDEYVQDQSGQPYHPDAAVNALIVRAVTMERECRSTADYEMRLQADLETVREQQAARQACRDRCWSVAQELAL